MELAQKGVHYLLDFINSIPVAGWYIAGSVLGASGLLIGIINWKKRRQIKQNLDKLEDWIITVNLWIYSSVLTIGSFVIAVLAFGVDPHLFFPYLGDHAPQIITLATGLYTFSKAAKKKLEARRKSRLHVTDQLIDGINDIPSPGLAPTPDAPAAATTPQIPPRPSADLLS
jgi:hypothetical protein